MAAVLAVSVLLLSLPDLAAASSKPANPNFAWGE